MWRPTAFRLGSTSVQSSLRGKRWAHPAHLELPRVSISPLDSWRACSICFLLLSQEKSQILSEQARAPVVRLDSPKVSAAAAYILKYWFGIRGQCIGAGKRGTYADDVHDLNVPCLFSLSLFLFLLFFFWMTERVLMLPACCHAAYPQIGPPLRSIMWRVSQQILHSNSGK